MTFRDLDDYNKTRRNTYAELNKFTKNGLDVNKNNTEKPSWEEYVAITAWSCYILDSRNTQRFKEFYELFEKEVNMSYAYVFYADYIFRFNKYHMMFRKNYTPIDFFRELPGHHKNGDPFDMDEMFMNSKNWNQMTAQSYWGFYLSKNRERFKEFYKLFDEWGKVATYTLPSDFDFKSLVGCMITNHFGFLTAANGELQQFINYKDTAPRFLEFLDIIEKGVDVEDE